MEISNELNKNLKTIFNFLVINKSFLKIKNLKYEKQEISGKYANKKFIIVKQNNFISTAKPKLNQAIKAFIEYSNCKKRKIDEVLNEFEHGRLHMGKSNLIVTEKKQALAVALRIANNHCEPKNHIGSKYQVLHEHIF